MAKGKIATRDVREQEARFARQQERKSETSSASEAVIALVLQQKCLDIFRDALAPDHDETATVQEVKGHLYNRDFGAAFGKEEYLRVYAGRWSPSRALGYMQVLRNAEVFMKASDRDNGEGRGPAKKLDIVCVGGGAGAEVVALAGWLNTLQQQAPGTLITATFVDIASWAGIVEKLHQASVTAPELSKYASAAARANNHPLVDPTTFSANFVQQDVLSWAADGLSAVIQPTTNLITLFFTLNELYTTSVPRTQAFLSQLTPTTSPGTVLLVVDSPGSYSTVSINGAEKRYPMQWLLDYTLLNAGKGKEEDAKWEKVAEEESKWFRLPQGLRYPIALENMRYQMHVYRRIGGGSERGAGDESEG